MSDQPGAIPLGLAQQEASRSVDPEQLESLGKKAAAYYIEHKGTLNDAVTEIVKEARLSPEQVKRVCEFANTSAYLSEFEKSGEQRNVTFDGGPANPSVVLKDLNDGSSPNPSQIKLASLNAPTDYRREQADDLLQDAFGGGMEKVARAHALHADPVDDLADLRTNLQDMEQRFVSQMSSGAVALDDIRTDLCKTAEQSLHQGASLNDMIYAWSRFSEPGKVKEAAAAVLAYLRERKDDLPDLDGSMEKRASAGIVPNPNHPLIEQFQAFARVSHEQKKLAHALDITREQLAEVNARLKVA
jgi:hypothetical protein